MRVLGAISLGARFALGATLGAVLGVGFFFIALMRAARPVHAEGALCRGVVVPRAEPLGQRLAGPVLARFSGAFADQRGQRADVLGLMLRLRRAEHAESQDLRHGDQDLVLGTFESFRTALRDRDATNVHDYLANRYSTVAPWWLAELGPATLRMRAVTEVSAPTAVPAEAEPGARLERLDEALRRGDARLLLVAELGGGREVELAEVHLLERLRAPDHAMQASMFNCGRGMRPVGFRNGLRATLYPMSQIGRLLRGR